MSIGSQVLCLCSNSVDNRINKYLVRWYLHSTWISESSIGATDLLPRIEKNAFGQQDADWQVRRNERDILNGLMLWIWRCIFWHALEKCKSTLAKRIQQIDFSYILTQHLLLVQCWQASDRKHYFPSGRTRERVLLWESSSPHLYLRRRFGECVGVYRG